MTTVYVCDICKEPLNPAKEVIALIQTELKHEDCHFHKACLNMKIPNLWVLQ